MENIRERLICVTNRQLCESSFLQQLEKVAACRPAAIILREKDLTAAAYKELAEEVLAIGETYQVPIILHSFAEVALELQHPALHLPLAKLRELHQQGVLGSFTTLGASCHSLEDALEAEQLGCTYITLGHIFSTACKPGLPPRGLGLLTTVCSRVQLPVWAIGGITPERLPQVLQAGAQGGCIMSGLMQVSDPATILK